MSLYVEAAGPGVTIQDSGRFGFARYGVPASGPMDWFSFAAAQSLVGNPERAAAIEVGGGLTVTAASDMLVTVAGAGYSVWVQGRSRPLWMAFLLRKSWTMVVEPSGIGSWAYLAVAGSFNLPPALGSTATYTRGKLGGLQGRHLQAGDSLNVGPAMVDVESFAGRELAEAFRPLFSRSVSVDIVLGPQANYFEPESLEALLNGTYKIGRASDRMGYRLEGPALMHRAGADIVSDGMVMGCVQVPADGQPIVMMADGPTTGGYPKVGVVATASLPLVAQCEPSRSELRFVAVTVAEAQSRLQRLREQLKAGILEPH